MNKVLFYKILKWFELNHFLDKRAAHKKFNSDKATLIVQKGLDDAWSFEDDRPILTDWSDEAGVMKGHYFHQDLLVASLIYKSQPQKHVDVGSRIDGFVAHVASFREIEILDIRQLSSTAENISFAQADFMHLDEKYFEYCDSVSSLHAIEHFGLGRYGDPIDYFGYRKAIQNVHKLLKPRGTFYLSLPIGKQGIYFNAHRVFSVSTVMQEIATLFDCLGFSYVDDNGDLHRNIDLSVSDYSTSFGCTYGCGIFVLKKK